MNIETPTDTKKEIERNEANNITTFDDYDAAAEARLREERVNRGYSDREPTDYALSTVERWRQDAQDWSRFRDAVWTYAISVSQQYASTGIIPCTLEEFKAHLASIPCEWTYQDIM